MGENKYYPPIRKSQHYATSTMLSLDFNVPSAKVMKLLQIRCLLSASYSGTFRYSLIKTDTNYSQNFDITMTSDNIYKELNMICEESDIIRLSTLSNVASSTHYFELAFGNDGS